jgi:23S rRNA (cytidine1920-2'-O)/16S rRNA (cytidine1409-2'-O)-methyltransferase
MNAKKERIDKILVDRGLTHSRERARALIMAGQVVVADHKVEKPGHMVPVDAEVRIKGEQMPFVSRGGLKLQKALDEFKIDVAGLVALDVGASTGGFTDCLLQRGARKVIAVDVGYGQLAWKLRQDERVLSLEKTNIRHLTADRLPEAPDIAVIDASFISLAKVLPSAVALIRDGGAIIALIKPQFEVGPGQVGKGGVVRDAEKQREVVAAVTSTAEGMGLLVKGVTESPLLGAKGNREFLIIMEKVKDRTGVKAEG